MDFLYFLFLYSKPLALPARVIKRFGYQIDFLKKPCSKWLYYSPFVRDVIGY